MDKPAKVVVVGTGAMGSVYAALMKDASHDVWAVDIWKEHVDAINDHGLRVEGASGDRTEGLRRVEVPTLVVHGRQDPLITLSGGEATAAAIPGAELLVFGKMGHDMPERYWPQLADAIHNVAVRGEQTRKEP